MFSDGGYVEDDVLFVSVLCGHLCVDLVGDDMEGPSGYQLEFEFLQTGCGGEFVGDDNVGVYEVSSCTGVYKCGEGDGILL